MPAMLIAQETATPTATGSLYPGYHRHDGFYLSMNIGPALGGTILDMKNEPDGIDQVIFRGPGAVIDLKIGGAIQENLILSFDIIGRTIRGPEEEFNTSSGSFTVDASDDLTMADNSYGIGLTKYFMPENIFVSGTLSSARMVQTINGHNGSTSEWGYAAHLKVGKEWWVGKNWGLGVSGGYGFAMADDKKDPNTPDYSGTLTSHQFYVLLNTTFN